MKTYSFEQLHKENPDLLAAVVQGMLFAVPQISKHVQETLEALGGTVEHGSFMRLINDDGDKILFVELIMWFDEDHIEKPYLKEIIFYDDQESYDKARIDVERTAASKFGQKLGVTHYGGKFIGKILNKK